ncbi:MAG: non-ribosomal peptide synthetase, partial [Candidatus Aminicenantes bacterium]
MRSLTITGKAAVAASQNIKERDYWLKKFPGTLEKTGFPPTHKKTGDKPQIDKVKFRFSQKHFLRLMTLSNESDARLHMILCAGLVVLLYKYTGNKDIIIGTPIYKQDFEGEFINT